MQVNSKKDVTGTTAEFLEIEIDTIKMEARLSEEKLRRAKQAITDCISKALLHHKDLEFLVGYLSFVSKVVKPGRAFLRRLYNILVKGSIYIRLNTDIKRDLQ